MMLTKTNYTVDPWILQEAVKSLPKETFRVPINYPTGDFFYDPWQMDATYIGTVWDKLILAIKEPIGEARIVTLNPKQSYQTHADIDDRFHLNITGEESYLIDLLFGKLHKLNADGVWYDMDAGREHTAANFGRTDRVQLVVRKLLKRGHFDDPINVTVISNLPSADDSRFMFDNRISPWLNNANKQGKLDNFSHTETSAKFTIERSMMDELKFIAGELFDIQH